MPAPGGLGLVVASLHLAPGGETFYSGHGPLVGTVVAHLRAFRAGRGLSFSGRLCRKRHA